MPGLDNSVRSLDISSQQGLINFHRILQVFSPPCQVLLPFLGGPREKAGKAGKTLKIREWGRVLANIRRSFVVSHPTHKKIWKGTTPGLLHRGCSATPFSVHILPPTLVPRHFFFDVYLSSRPSSHRCGCVIGIAFCFDIFQEQVGLFTIRWRHSTVVGHVGSRNFSPWLSIIVAFLLCTSFRGGMVCIT